MANARKPQPEQIYLRKRGITSAINSSISVGVRELVKFDLEKVKAEFGELLNTFSDR